MRFGFSDVDERRDRGDCSISPIDGSSVHCPPSGLPPGTRGWSGRYFRWCSLDAPEREALRSFLAALAGGQTLVLLGSRGEEKWLAEGTFAKNVHALQGLDAEAASSLADEVLRRAGAKDRQKELAFKDLMALLAGFPLALQVVLPHLAAKTSAAVLEELRQGLAALDIKPGTDPVEARTRSLMACIDYIRQWASKFYGCVNSRVRFLHEDNGLIEHHTVLAPDQLKDVDPAHLDRVIAIDKVLFGPVPYRGRLDLTVALFSVKSTDLAAPYIDLLTSLADTAGLAFLAAAKPYIEPLRKGADLLFGTATASQLEIGFDRDFAALDGGYYVAIRAPKTAVALTQLRLDPNDFRLTDANGQPFGDYPYFVLAIERSAQRPDWMLIPDLKAAWDEARQAFVKASGEVDGVLERFERQCLASPDLVPAVGRGTER